MAAVGCAAPAPPAAPPARGEGSPPALALFPVENLSGRPAPLEEIRRHLAGRLASQGYRVVDDAVLERVVTRHRVRYTAGLELGFAKALRQETGAAGVIIPSLETYAEGPPPRVALFARLVSTGDAPAVRWIDGIGAAGDDAPGLLGLGLVEDPGELLARCADTVADSLIRHLATAGGRVEGRPWAKKFGPKLVYRSERLDPTRAHSVAVVPFFNKSPRKYAGEIAALHLIRNLLTFPGLEVVEPGIVREELLRFRIIMSDGISLPQTETVLNAVSADLVLNGEVLEYRDPLGPGVPPRVDFAVLFIERRTQRVVYSAYSHNTGDDGVFFFDVGRVLTAHAMTAQMARAVAQRMVLGPPTAGTAETPRRPDTRRP